MGRKISVSEYGIFALLFPLVQTLIPTASFGLSTSMMRYYFDKTISREDVFFSVFIAWLISVFRWYPLVFFLFYFTPMYHIDIASYKLGDFIAALLISLLCFGFSQIVTESFRAQKRAFAFVISNTLSRLIILIILVITVNLGYHSGLQLMWGVSIATALVFFYSLFLYLSSLKFSINKSLIKELLHFGYPVMLTPISTLLLFLGNRYVLLFFSSTEEIGIYSMAVSLVQIVALIPAAFGRWWVPELFSRLRDGKTDADFFKNIVTSYLVVFICFCLTLQVFSKVLLVIVGNHKYLASLPLFPILISGFLFETYYTFSVDRLYYAKHVRAVFLLNLISGVFNVIITFILVRFFGMIGAAISFSISMAIQAAISVVFAKKSDGIKLPVKLMLFYMIFGVFGLFTIYMLLRYNFLYFIVCIYAYIDFSFMPTQG